MIHLVSAMDRNGLIGLSGGLPWKSIKGDMNLFKTLTTGHTVVMGRATWDSLPERFRPLPNRKNIILSTSLLTPPHPDCDVVKDIQDLDLNTDLFVIGGAKVYESFLKLRNYHQITMHLSVFNHEIIFDGDATNLVYFPSFGDYTWNLKSTKAMPPEPNAPLGWTYKVYQNF